MEQNKIKIKEQDLVLNVGNNVDLSKWDESKYDKFVLTLTDDRKYQEEAIYAALRFTAGRHPAGSGRNRTERSVVRRTEIPCP